MPLKVNLAHHPLDALCVVLDLGHVLPQDPAGHVLRRGWAAAAEQLHQHQRLVNVAHAHAFGDVLAQALVGGGVGRGHGGMVAGVRRGVALVKERPLAITLAHECSPMQTTHLFTRPRSATTCSQTRILSVALRPGYFAHLVTPLYPGHVFGMICSSMDRLARLRGSRAAPMGRKLSSVLR